RRPDGACRPGRARHRAAAVRHPGGAGWLRDRGRRALRLLRGRHGRLPVDVALLPIWGWGPTMGPGHMDPGRAAEAAALLGARLAIPIHWGTYYPVHL